MFQTQTQSNLIPFTFTTLPEFPSQPFSPSQSTYSNMNQTPSTANSVQLSPYKTSIDSIDMLDTDFPTPSPTNLGQKSFSLNVTSKKITKKAKETSPKAAKSKEIFADSPKKRNPWSASEDSQLLELITMHGKAWAKVASFMNGRSGKQVRDRYLNVLAANIRKGPWTEAEDQKIWVLYKQLGNHWCKIAACMEGRTEIQVKNRFYTHLKKNFEFWQVKTGLQMEFCQEEDNLALVNTSRTVSTNSTVESQISDPTDMISYDAQEQDNFWKNGNFDFLNF